MMSSPEDRLHIQNSAGRAESSTSVLTGTEDKEENSAVLAHNNLPTDKGGLLGRVSPFWRDRLIEGGMIASMALYYIVGNQNLGTGSFFHLNALFALPFLLIFAVLCWYRLAFAVALLPLALPYYLLQKPVIGSYAFSLTEVALGVCVVVGLAQLLLWRDRWQYWLSWRELRERVGLFALPLLIFLAAAAFSTVIAVSHQLALRAFRKEVLDPLLYLLLVLYCLRSRGDLARLLGALLGTGLLVALLGVAQYVFFRHSLVADAGNVLRVHAAYGSANDIGLLFDYVLPVGFAMVMARLPKMVGVLQPWMFRALAATFCVLLLLVLYQSQSEGAWIAITAAALFIVGLSIRHRKLRLVGALAFVVIAALTLFVLHTRITHFLFDGHVNAQGLSTATKRLYLWQSALKMIHDSPVFGYGMDNWLCHYSRNAICYIPGLRHYWILRDPATHAVTGLAEEPDLSHPHNILLNVWVSIGIFGLLAFVALLLLFFWLFARVLRHLRSTEDVDNLHLQWMTIGVGAAMLAAFLHGQVDNSFLEQDLAFCFWTLAGALLLLRMLSGTSWRRLRS